MEDDANELLLDNPVVEDADAVVAAPEGDDGDIHIEVEGEEIGEEPDLVKHLRTVARDAQRELAEARKSQQPAPVDPGPKPTLDDCEWDPDKYEAALLAWNETNRKAEQAKQAQQQAAQTQTQQFERARVSYTAKALQLGIKDPDAVVTKVAAALTPEHAGFILQYADNPASLMAALDAHPALLAKIAAEPDPMRQLVMISKMEAKVKVTRKGPPPAEAATIVTGSAQVSATKDKTADALFAKGEKSGDMSEYYAHQRALRKAGRA